MFIRAN